MTVAQYVRRWRKDPNALLDYTFDWSVPLGSDTLTGASFSVSGPDNKLIVTASSNTTYSATVWLSGGTDGFDYNVTCSIATAQGRDDDRTALLQVRQR